MLAVESYIAVESTVMGGIELELVIRNDHDLGFRMIDATVEFVDVLGRSVLTTFLDPDTAAAPGQSVTQLTFGSNKRLLRAQPDDITVFTCVRAAVFKDGTVYRVGQ